MSAKRVDFYLFDESAELPWEFTCRLIEKAYYKGHRVFVFCDGSEHAQLLDELLWTFKEDSFIPHNLEGEGPLPPPPVQIGYSQPPKQFNDILLNLSSNIPSFYTRFHRVIEFVVQKEQGRMKYRQYKAQGCTLLTHQMTASEEKTY